MFVSMEKEDIDELSEINAQRSLLRGAQKLVKGDINTPVANSLPLLNASSVRVGRGNRDDRDPPPPPDGNHNLFNLGDEDPPLNPHLGLDQVKDNADTYLVKEESQTEEGKKRVNDLYGSQKGGGSHH